MKGVILEPPLEQDRQSQLPRRIQTGVGLAISLVGLTAYLYLLGGLVWWLRFTAARLPADEAITAVDDKRLLATGSKAMLFELLAIVTLMLMAWCAWRLVRSVRGREVEEDLKVHERNPLAWAIVLFGISLGATLFAGLLNYFSPWQGTLVGSTLLGSIAGGMIGAVIGAFAEEESGLRDKLETPAILWGVSIFLIVVAGLTLSAPAGVVMIAIVSFAHLGKRLARLPKVRNPIHLVPGVLIVGVAFGVIAATYQATPPVTFARAVISLKEGGSITGGYVGESQGGVLLAECEVDEEDPSMGGHAKLRLIPTKEIEAIDLGGTRYAFDHGQDPSLFDLARYFFKRDVPHEWLQTVAVDPRHNRLACGLNAAVKILDRDLLLLPGEPPTDRFFVYGEGEITVSGHGVVPSTIPVRSRGTVSIRVAPRSWVQKQVAETGEAVVQVGIDYTSLQGFSEHRDEFLTYRGFRR
jgi:hypothetical protein